MRWMPAALALTVAAMPAEASTGSVEAIETAVRDYEAGFRTGDMESFRRAFAPDSYFVRPGGNGAIEATPIATLLPAWADAPDPDARIEIIGVHLTAETLAMVNLRLHYRDMVFADQLNLLRIDGAWRIVAKLSVR